MPYARADGTDVSTPSVLRASSAIAFVVALTVVLSACDWTTFRHDAAHTGNNASETAVGIGNVSTLTPIWSATTGGSVVSSPAVVDGVVYVGSADGRLHAYSADGTANCAGDPKTCTELWTAGTGYLDSSPAVANGVVYVNSESRMLMAFDATGGANCSGIPKTCEPLWTAYLARGLARRQPLLAGRRGRQGVRRRRGQSPQRVRRGGNRQLFGRPDRVSAPVARRLRGRRRIVPGRRERRRVRHRPGRQLVHVRRGRQHELRRTEPRARCGARPRRAGSRRRPFPVGSSTSGPATTTCSRSMPPAAPTVRAPPRSALRCGRPRRARASTRHPRSPTAPSTSAPSTASSMRSTRREIRTVAELRSRARRCGRPRPAVRSNRPPRWQTASCTWAPTMDRYTRTTRPARPTAPRATAARCGASVRAGRSRRPPRSPTGACISHPGTRTSTPTPCRRRHEPRRRGSLCRAAFARRRNIEKLRTRGIAEPVLELLGSPSAPTDEQQPDVGMIERPEDVGGAATSRPRGSARFSCRFSMITRWFA